VSETLKSTSKRNRNEMNGLAKHPPIRRKNRGGAPKGNRNAWKTGAHSQEARALFSRIAAFKRRVRTTLAAIEAGNHG
jgi:uncharacterized protein YjcR